MGEHCLVDIAKAIDVESIGHNYSSIERRLSLSELDRRLLSEKEKRSVSSEHWFRQASLWYALAVSYNNPYNFGNVHSELFLLHENKAKLMPFLRESALVFYGVGVGDTEIELVDWQLSNDRYAEVVTIDVNEEFLRKFQHGLWSKSIENTGYKIMFKGYHALFEQLTGDDFVFDNSLMQRTAHVCLGNTIGNFEDQHKLYSMFSSHMNSGDLLVLGFQLDTHIDVLFRKYASSKEFARFVLNWVEDGKISRLNWMVDRKNSVIKAIYEDIEVFRSRKYDPVMLTSLVEGSGFRLLTQVIDEHRNSCVQVYERRQ